MMTLFQGENMQIQYSALDYRNDLYFHDYKFAIEIDENDHDDRNIDYEIKRQKAIKVKLGCKLIRIDPDKKDFDVYNDINEISNIIDTSNNRLKALIGKISRSLLVLQFKSNNMIKSKALKHIAKKILPNYE